MTGILAGLIGSFKKAVIAWTTASITNQVYRDATYASLTNGKFFAFGPSSTNTSTTDYRYSTDGSSWSGGTLPASAAWRACATNGSRIVVVAGTRTTGYYTDNGTTWTITGTIFASNQSPRNMIWDGTQYITADFTGGGSTIRYSTDGVTSWTSVTAGEDGTVGYGGGRHIVLASDSTAQTTARTTTSFPTGWASITMPSSGIWRTIVYGGGTWVACRSSGTTYGTSTDGTTWTSRTLPAAIGDGGEHAKMIYTGGKFYYYYVDNVYSSEDGINWVTEATVTGGALNVANGWAVGEGKILGFGWNTVSSGSDTYLIGQ